MSQHDIAWHEMIKRTVLWLGTTKHVTYLSAIGMDSINQSINLSINGGSKWLINQLINENFEYFLFFALHLNLFILTFYWWANCIVENDISFLHNWLFDFTAWTIWRSLPGFLAISDFLLHHLSFLSHQDGNLSLETSRTHADA